jgi:hypothetical protein
VNRGGWGAGCAVDTGGVVTGAAAGTAGLARTVVSGVPPCGVGSVPAHCLSFLNMYQRRIGAAIGSKAASRRSLRALPNWGSYPGDMELPALPCGPARVGIVTVWICVPQRIVITILILIQRLRPVDIRVECGIACRSLRKVQYIFWSAGEFIGALESALLMMKNSGPRRSLSLIRGRAPST